MNERSLKVLLQRGGEITVKGLPQALAGPSGQKLHADLSAAKKTSAWPFEGARGQAAVLDLLDLDLVNVLAAGWNKYRTLSEFADPARHPAGESNDVALDDHELSVSYQPALDIVVGGVRHGSIEFALTIALELKAVILVIEGGRITGVRTGSCSGNVKLELDGAEIVNRELKSVDLPGLVELGPGLKIPVLGIRVSESAEVPA